METTSRRDSPNCIVFFLLVWIVSPSLFCAGVKVWEGESVILPCTSQGHSSDVNVYWCKVTGNRCTAILTKLSEKISVAQEWEATAVQLVNLTSLKFPSVSYPRENGWFRCRLEGNTDNDVVSLDVIQPVQSVNLSGPENLIPENNVTSFSCLANGGHPPPVFRWYIDDDIPNSGLIAYRQDDHSSTVKLIAKKTLNNKTIKCGASVWNKSVFKQLRLSVAYKPTVTVVNSQMDHSEGEEFNLVCEVDANPPAEVTWSFHGNIVSNENVFRIKRFGQSQTGIYVCSATNSQGNGTASIVLTLTERGKSTELNNILILIAICLGGLGVLGVLVLSIQRIFNRRTTLPTRRCTSAHVLDPSQVEPCGPEPYDDAIELRALQELSGSNLVRETVPELSTSSESDDYEKIGGLQDDTANGESEYPSRSSEYNGYSNPYCRRVFSFNREGGPYEIIGGWVGKRRICSMKELGCPSDQEFATEQSQQRRTY